MLKGTRRLLLKNRENLDRGRNEHERLDAALRANRPLMTAYYLKEELHRIWEQENRAAAEHTFDAWIATGMVSEVSMLKKFARILLEHREGILNYYESRITTAALEGTNTKIRVLQRRAYGYRDREYLKLRILALHETNLKMAI